MTADIHSTQNKADLPLNGIQVIELAGLAPGPYCGMILADFGASVIRVDRPSAQILEPLARGKRSILIDLKSQDGLTLFKKLCSNADVLIEPFRPGTLEKWGCSPD